jgi:DNA-binding MarR family transcriptional regulator
MSRPFDEAALRGVIRLSRQVEITLAEFQLSVPQYRAMDRLSGGSAAGRSLAEWLAVKPPSVTALVDGLVVRGLVERRPDPDDRRRVTHELTARGRAEYAGASAALAARLDQVLAHVQDSAHADHMVAALGDWNAALELAREAKLAAKRQAPVAEPAAQRALR